MRIINDYGALYRLTEPAYERFLKDSIAGGLPKLDSYGKLIGVIDFTVEDFEEALKVTVPAPLPQKNT